MLAEYLTRRDAENYARELARHYGPDVHFGVVSIPDPVFGDIVWYVLGTGMVDGRVFAEYAQWHKEGHKALAEVEKPILSASSNEGDRL
jgi:hypothetical protein